MHVNTAVLWVVVEKQDEVEGELLHKMVNYNTTSYIFSLSFSLSPTLTHELISSYFFHILCKLILLIRKCRIPAGHLLTSETDYRWHISGNTVSCRTRMLPTQDVRCSNRWSVPHQCLVASFFFCCHIPSEISDSNTVTERQSQLSEVTLEEVSEEFRWSVSQIELHSFSLQPPPFLVHLVSQHRLLFQTVFPTSDLLLLKSCQLCDPYFLVSLSCPSSRMSTAWQCRPTTSCWPRAPRTAQPSCGR